MEDFKIDDIPVFEDAGLKELVENLKSTYKGVQNNFAKICYSIYQIYSYCKKQYFCSVNKKYYDSQAILLSFGFEKSQASRYRQCFTRFIQGTTYDNVSVKTFFSGFSPSKLFELLKLSDSTLEKTIDKKLIRPDMSVKQIRSYIKSLKENDNVMEVIEDENLEEEIEMAYNPTKYYEFNYFEKKSKNQLINIVWALQKEYQKLKEKKK